MASSTRTNRRFSIAKTKITTDFALPEAPLSWSWEGIGRTGYLIARRPDAVTSNNPVSGVTRTVSRFILIPALDIYNQYFTSIPVAAFKDARAGSDATNIIFSLDQEEP